MKISIPLTTKYLRSLLRRRGSLPIEVQLEVTNRCNFDCEMCPRELLPAPERHMDEETFAKVLDQISGVKEVGLTGWGEPLVFPKFFDYARALKSRYPGVAVRFTTNGALLTAEKIRKILEVGIDQVSISMESVDEPTSIGHIDPKQVASHVTALIRERGTAARPVVSLQVILSRDGEKALLDLVSFASQAGVNYVNLLRLVKTFDPSISRPDRQEELDLIRKARKLGRTLGIPVLSVNDDDWRFRLLTHGDTFCFKTAYHAYVTVDGDVTPCCLLRDRVMGNLREQSLGSIWQGESFLDFFKNQRDICQWCDQLMQGCR